MLQVVEQSNAKPFLIHAKVNLCAIKESSKILGKKWYLIIVHRLMGHKMGFNELKEAVGDISAKILSQALQDLQRKSIVDRRIASQNPVRVEYSLSPKGADLAGVLHELQGWGKRWDICNEGPASQLNTQGPVRPPDVAAPA